MSGLRLYNTRTRRKEVFVPGDPERITMYVCGPTVYSRAHIGNARPAVVFDVLARLLQHLYGADSLVYARNITDIDDKIMAAAAERGVSTDAVAAEFERHYVDDMAALGVAAPDLQPHATHHVPGMIALISALIERGVAYAAEGHVLFSVAADPEYGTLSGRDRAAMLAGARVEVAPYKRDGADFVLWKPSVDRQPGWESPWGRGRPGWHIECSAMIRELLGETIDIHGGGQDLIFPHHENEAAQSRCAHGGAELARVWMHNGFLSMGADKMSKSLGNVVTVDRLRRGTLIRRPLRGAVLRLALLSASYRQPLEWNDDLLEESAAKVDQWARTGFAGFHTEDQIADEIIIDALTDDLNFALARARLEELSKEGKRESLGQEEAQKRFAFGLAMLGLKDLVSDMPVNRSGQSAHQNRVEQLLLRRTAAKKARDFATADRIRAELAAEGFLLEDGPGGTTWRRA